MAEGTGFGDAAGGAVAGGAAGLGREQDVGGFAAEMDGVAIATGDVEVFGVAEPAAGEPAVGNPGLGDDGWGVLGPVDLMAEGAAVVGGAAAEFVREGDGLF